MPIQFCDLLSDAEWEPSTVDAPADIAAALDGALWLSTGVDPAFNAFGWRLSAGTTIPRRHHNLRQLVIVFGGSATVAWGEDGSDGQETFTLGEFWVTEPGEPYTVTAGADGVVYVESWSAPVAELQTTWHEPQQTSS